MRKIGPVVAAFSAFSLMFVLTGFIAQQTIGYDSATSSVCVYDKATPPQCVPIGTVNSVAHAFAPVLPFTQTGSGAAKRDLVDRAKDELNLLDFRTSASNGNGVIDDGPMFRAAIAECTRLGTRRLYIPVPPTEWHIASVDANGFGMTFGSPAGSVNGCHLVGEARQTAGGWAGGVNIKLASGVNRPLIGVLPGASSPVLENLRLDGNRYGQTGWAGGPEGRLYTVQISDGSSSVEGSIILRNVHLTGGYNGNLYVGYGRGGTQITNSHSDYSGQSTTDISVYFNGFDADLVNVGVGSTTGVGVLFNEGSQYHWSGGAVWMNEVGISINGSKVEHLSADQLNLQRNKCAGLFEANAAPFSGKQAGGHVFTNTTFEGNSARTNGVCPDVYVDTSTLVSLVNPVFVGSVVLTDNKPSYNIETIGPALVAVANPKFGATANVTAAFRYPASVACTNCTSISNIWTPTVYGETTAGSPTYSVQTGRWVRNGSEMTVRFAVQWSSLGGAAGNIRIGNLPIWSKPNGVTDIGYCTIAIRGGWTGGGGYTEMFGFVQQNENSIRLYKNGSGLPSATTAAGEFASSGYLHGTCSYPVN